MLVDLQLNAAALTWPELRGLARWADRDGFGALWVFDHLAGRSVRGDRMLEAFTLLGALAVVTRRIGLGTLVLNVSQRQPAVAALAAASLAVIGEERPVFLGLGAGASPASRWSAELRAVGQAVEPDAARRRARVEETIDVCRLVWSADRPAELATMPLPRPTPRLHVGAGSLELAELAGRAADGLDVGWGHPRRDELVAAARRARARSPRAAEPLTLTTYAPYSERLRSPDDAEHRAMVAAGVDRLVLIRRTPVIGRS